MTPLSLLRRHWGYDSFRPLQEEIITSVLQGHDTLGLLPTGGGKSITFQVPALMLPGITLVVTPLISLMKDQVDNLRDSGIKACHLHSGMSRREQTLAIDRCAAGHARLLYVSPEKLRSESFTSILPSLQISLIVVDEAHCISQWGYDFRPSYLKIRDIRLSLPGVPVLALTASATPRVAADIMERLGFDTPRMFARSFHRDNLSYIVRHDIHKERTILRVLRATTGSAIVYVRSRKRTREIAQTLAAEGISAEFYHAGLDPADKADRQNRWKAGLVRVMVATNAFGMGIDKPDVRTVIHCDIPSSLEEYYQEAGRAGRDGKPAFAVLVASPADKALLTRRISDSFPPPDYIARVYELACNFLNVAVGSGYDHTFEFDLNRFIFTFRLKPVPTRAALMLLTRAGYIEYGEDTGARARVMILADKRALYDLSTDPTTDSVLQCLLRSYTGLFADYTPVSEAEIARRTSLTETQVYQALLTLTRLHVLHYIPRRTLPYIYFPTSRELPRHIILPPDIYTLRRQAMTERIEAMKAFVFSTSGCRVSRMLSYFGETPAAPCGKCDICRTNRPAPQPDDALPDLDHTIIYLASQPGGHTPAYIIAQLPPGRREEAIERIRHLLDRGVISRLPGGELTAGGARQI